MGSSLIRDGTRVPCSGRRILFHRATREALGLTLDVCWRSVEHLPGSDVLASAEPSPQRGQTVVTIAQLSLLHSLEARKTSSGVFQD